MGCSDPEVLISGPAGTGKSRAALEKILLLALEYPNMRALIVRKTATSLKTSGQVTWQTSVAHELLLNGVLTWRVADSQYVFENGSVVVLGGLDKASRIMSTEYDIIFVQEATELDENDWESLTTRLRNGVVPFQQLIADCNPSTPTHWLKARTDSGKTKLLESHHEDNPTLFNLSGEIRSQGASYLSKLDNLTGVRYQRLRKGRWVAAEGVIYEDFGSIHLVDRDSLLQEPGFASWTRWWAVDFGFTNPFVLQCWAEDPDGRLYLYRELYRTQTLVEDHAKAILDIVAPEGKWIEPKPRGIICDHDAEGRATLERGLGMGTTAAHKAVTEGIQAVQVRCKVKADGRPRLFIVRDCTVRRDSSLADSHRPTSTLEEVPGYVWSDKSKKEEPIKQDDHGCDAMRYIVAARDFHGPSHFRWVNV
jgi:phage terminase large subunit